MSKPNISKHIFFISFVFLIGVWVLISSLNLVDPLFLPKPYELWESITSLFSQKDYLDDILISIYRVFFAFFLSLILAVPLALLMANYTSINNLLSPYIDFIRYLPVPTLIPLSILFFGIGESAKIVLLFVGTFFQLILLILDDLKNIPKSYLDIAFTLNFSQFKKMKTQLLSILPKLYDNSRITLGWCWTYLVIAELVASEAGIGHMIKEAQRFSNTPDVYIGILTMGIIGLTTDLIFKTMYPHLFPYIKPVK